MRQLLGDLTINLDQAKCIASAMQRVASSDGVHDRETAMIEGFINTCAEEEGAGNIDLTSLVYDKDQISAVMTDDSHIEALIKSCYMLSLADGVISDEEAACINTIADDLGVNQSQRDAWVKEAKVYMLKQFEGIHLFSDQALAIGKELGLEDGEIKAALGLE